MFQKQIQTEGCPSYCVSVEIVEHEYVLTPLIWFLLHPQFQNDLRVRYHLDDRKRKSVGTSTK
jgi:hypothetical protein